MDVEFEEVSTSDDLQTWQNDSSHIDMTDEDISRDFPNVLKETEVEVFIFKPSDLQITIDVSAVRVPVPKISVVILLVGCHRKTAICSNANCNKQIILINFKTDRLS